MHINQDYFEWTTDGPYVKLKLFQDTALAIYNKDPRGVRREYQVEGKPSIPAVDACIKPLKLWNESMQYRCWMNLEYWKKQFEKKETVAVILDGARMAPEDFIIGSFCLLSRTDCKSNVCWRLRFGLAKEKEVKEEVPKIVEEPLDRFLKIEL